MKKAILILFTYIFVLTINADTQNQSENKSKEVDKNKDIALLESRINDLEKRINTVAEYSYRNKVKDNSVLTDFHTIQIEQLKRKNETLDNFLSDIQKELVLKEERIYAAILDPSDPKFGISKNEIGLFPVSIENIEPYLNGYKIKLNIANLTSCEISNPEISIRYGRKTIKFPEYRNDLSPSENQNILNKYKEDSEKIKNETKTLTIESTTALKSGNWNSVEIIIPSAKTENIELIQVYINAKTISLRKDKN